MADTGARTFGLTEPLGPQEEEESGFQQIIDAFRRRFWVFASVAAAVVLLIMLYSLTATRQYTAVADVQLEVRSARVLGAEAPPVFEGMTADTVEVDTETEVLRSRALAGRVVDALNLVEDPMFNPPDTGGLLGPIRALLGAGPASPADVAAVRAAARENAISNLMQIVDIRRHGLTLILRISVTFPDGARAAQIANAYAQNYLTMQLDTKFETIRTANEFIASRLQSLAQEVQDKERLVEEERSRSGLLTTEGATLTERTMSDLNAELIRARADLAAAQARLQGLAAGESSAEALNSPVVANLRAQEAELAREQADLSTRYLPRHPEMQRIARERADMQSRIQEEVSRITESIRTEVRIAQNRVASIQGSLSSQRETLEESNVGAVRLRALEREAEASRATFEGFLQRYRQVAETSGIERADARIVSPASVPLHPSSPNLRLNLVLGAILGMALGAIGVFLVELLEQSLRTPEDVKARLGLPWLSSVPFLDRRTRTLDGELVAPEEFVLQRPLSAFGEALRTLRAAVFYSSPDRKVKVVAVTSALPDEGKTTTAISLARISALAGSKTVLVDCDLRRRSATHCLGLEVEKGLTEVLFRTASLNEVIQKDPGSGMDVVPLAQAEFTPRDLFGSEAMRSLLEALRVRYDVVVLDTAPVMPIADSRVLGPLADSVVLVARWGRTPASVVRAAADRLRSHGARVTGVVLEGVENGLVSRLLYDRPDNYSELYQTYYIR